MLFMIMGRSAILRHPIPSEWAVVSIADPGDNPVPLADDRSGGLLRLAFADDDGGEAGSFDEAMAADILSFYGEVRERQAPVLLIHCMAGVCRSPAVAAALRRLSGGDDGPYFNSYVPNRHVYRTLIETARRLDVSWSDDA